jgi:hypothetical protein
MRLTFHLRAFFFRYSRNRDAGEEKDFRRALINCPFYPDKKPVPQIVLNRLI